jgi:hypothetical protein
VSPDDIYDMLEYAIGKAYTSSELATLVQCGEVPEHLNEKATDVDCMIDNFFYTRMFMLSAAQPDS